jgi:hypothetical protein
MHDRLTKLLSKLPDTLSPAEVRSTVHNGIAPEQVLLPPTLRVCRSVDQVVRIEIGMHDYGPRHPHGSISLKIEVN